ncbi:hypothetical protein INT43_004782 [Umbelopsis isabellina]|uniref:Cystinosin n=1 Tax=Mortierella isabellina TaxID=91625 RepID=A0A8H7PE49_MORIS|nr:hypothetical protein INT43_004782 [Umbelopsis isabellina]
MLGDSFAILKDIQDECKLFTTALKKLNISLISFVHDADKRRNGDNENLVRANDVLFSAHAFAITLFTIYQSLIYKRDDTQRISPAAGAFILTTIVGVAAIIVAIEMKQAMWIDLLYFMAWIKLAISVIKYLPQVWLNYKRQSTVGWSIHNILLDFTGGVLSTTQLLLDAWILGDWSGVTGVRVRITIIFIMDPVKFGLGFIAITFDIIFMIQHYILYRDRTDFYVNSVEEERQRLIAEGRLPRDTDDIFRRNRTDSTASATSGTRYV